MIRTRVAIIYFYCSFLLKQQVCLFMMSIVDAISYQMHSFTLYDVKSSVQQRKEAEFEVDRISTESILGKNIGLI